MEPLDLTEIGRYTKSLFVDMTSDLHSPPDQVIGLDRSIGHIQGDHAPGRVAVEVRRQRGLSPLPSPGCQRRTFTLILVPGRLTGLNPAGTVELSKTG